MGLSAADVDRVLEHMNADHLDASLGIARAHGYPAATAAEMTGVDEHGGTWQVVDGPSSGQAEAQLRVVWPGGPVSDVEGVRREVVALARGGSADSS